MSLGEVGPLKLKDFSCHMKVDERSTASNPTCVLNLVVNKKKQHLEAVRDDEIQGNSSDDDKITFEMESSVLDTLLDGLHRIQSQLSNAATKPS